MPFKPPMTIGGMPAIHDGWVDARSPADLETPVGGYFNGSAAHAASSIDTVAPADCLTHAGKLDVSVAADEESTTMAPPLGVLA